MYTHAQKVQCYRYAHKNQYVCVSVFFFFTKRPTFKKDINDSITSRVSETKGCRQDIAETYEFWDQMTKE